MYSRYSKEKILTVDEAIDECEMSLKELYHDNFFLRLINYKPRLNKKERQYSNLAGKSVNYRCSRNTKTTLTKHWAG